MKYVVVKPRGYADLTDGSREIQEFEVSKITATESFITQQVGKNAVSRKIGDYIFWIANPNEVIEIEDGEIEVPDTEENLFCNMLLNEIEFAFGGVVITSNYEATNDVYAGLNDQDIAYIMNAFTLADAVLVEDPNSGRYIAVDRIFDALLAPNGLSYVEYEDPFIEEIEGENDDDLLTDVEDEYEDKDPEIFDDIDYGDSELPMPELPDDLLVEVEDLEEENLEEFEEGFNDFESFDEVEEGIINEQ